MEDEKWRGDGVRDEEVRVEEVDVPFRIKGRLR